MNSVLAVEEEKQSASNPDFSQVPKYRIPRTQLAQFENTATTATVLSAYNIGFYQTSFLTALELDVSDSYIIGVTTTTTKLVHKKRNLTEALLGDTGKRVLEKVIGLIEETSQRYNWPMNYVEIAHVEDTEVENWQYVLITLFFHSTFEVADEYLHTLYNKLDSLSDTLDGEEQDTLQRKLFFDVATSI